MAESRLIGGYPVIGIRPTIDGRRGPLKVRESLEDQTMGMALRAKKLIEENVKYSNDTTKIEYDSNYNDCKYYYILQGLDNYITYMGRREDDANVLSQLDLFVYNSSKEPVSIPVIEAMVSGTNVVVNDCEMIREITSNGKYAVLYENDNDMEFATKVRGVLLDLEDYELISQVVKEETRQIFSIEKHICGLKQIYLKQLTINN